MVAVVAVVAVAVAAAEVVAVAVVAEAAVTNEYFKTSTTDISVSYNGTM